MQHTAIHCRNTHHTLHHLRIESCWHLTHTCVLCVVAMEQWNAAAFPALALRPSSKFRKGTHLCVCPAAAAATAAATAAEAPETATPVPQVMAGVAEAGKRDGAGASDAHALLPKSVKHAGRKRKADEAVLSEKVKKRGRGVEGVGDESLSPDLGGAVVSRAVVSQFVLSPPESATNTGDGSQRQRGSKTGGGGGVCESSMSSTSVCAHRQSPHKTKTGTLPRGGVTGGRAGCAGGVAEDSASAGKKGAGHDAKAHDAKAPSPSKKVADADGKGSRSGGGGKASLQIGRSGKVSLQIGRSGTARNVEGGKGKSAKSKASLAKAALTVREKKEGVEGRETTGREMEGAVSGAAVVGATRQGVAAANTGLTRRARTHTKQLQGVAASGVARSSADDQPLNIKSHDISVSASAGGSKRWVRASSVGGGGRGGGGRMYECRKMGNLAVRKFKFDEAIMHYSEAILLCGADVREGGNEEGGEGAGDRQVLCGCVCTRVVRMCCADVYVLCGKWCAASGVRMYITHYGVATISRLLKIIGLFCKRAP